MSDAYQIGPAGPEDAAAIADIYGHYVLTSIATFETVPPEPAEMAERMARVLGAGLPWLVAREAGGAVAGYAYASRWNPRQAYLYTCEDSIYLRRDALGRGLGTRMLSALIEAAEARGMRQMIGGVAAAAGTRPASLVLHERAGFVPVGRFRDVGRKFGQWIDVHYLQRALGDGAAAPPPEEPW